MTETNDHDLLIRVDTKVDLLTKTVNNLVSGTSRKIDNLEARVNSLEIGRKENQDGIKAYKLYMGIIIGIGVALIGLLIYHITGGGSLGFPKGSCTISFGTPNEPLTN
jgi:hypothetical protein